jgi:predicted MFS family arabinose efflux permease
MYFHLSVLFVYFFMLDMPVWEIELLLAVYAVTLMLTSKLNAAMLAKLPHKHVIAIGELIKAGGLIALIANEQLPVLFIGQILSGLGYSLAQGTDSSLLRTIVTDPESYKKAESGSSSYTFASFLLSGIIGSVIFNYSAEYAFWCSICANAVAIIAVMLISEPAHAQSAGSAEANKPLETSTQKFWKLYYALTRAFAMATFVGFLPYYFFVSVKVNLNLFGLVLSLFTLLGFIAARNILKIGAKFGFLKVAAISVILTALSLLLFGSSTHITIGIAALAVLGLASGGVRPLTVSNLNLGNLPPADRTAILSSMERYFGFANALLLIIGGVALQWIGFQWLMLASAVMYVILLTGGYRLYVAHSAAPAAAAKQTH